MDNNSYKAMSKPVDNGNRCSDCLLKPVFKGQEYALCLFHYVKMTVFESLSELNLAKDLDNEP